MKRRVILISALLLVGVTAFAQPNLDDPRSAKTVYMQDFEQSWEDFSTTVIDRIDQIQYYTKSGTSNGNNFKPWEDPSWQKGPIRTDSIIEIYQGNMVVCDLRESRNGSEIWGDDNPSSVAIVGHDDDDRYQFEQFGEEDKGGYSYFQFTSDTVIKINSYGAYSNLLAARYRRNLNIHLIPGNIQANSSYRLTFYVKAKTLPGHENYVATPTVYADLMRGYPHADKPLSMGYVANSSEHPYEYNKTFEYTKNDFYADNDWDNWEKVTFMTYYTNDSIADNYFFSDGYWWAEDTWTWKQGSVGNDFPYDLNYIVQPNKYYIRLGFPADYTVYSVDNISLTNSWIAGCDYYGDKMRIDFGYQTNLARLVAEEKARTNMNCLQLDNQYLTIWGLKRGFDENDPSSWLQIPLRSVEYHADGYMYAFTDQYQVGGVDSYYMFGDYDKVLVSFQNPQNDPSLTLTYTDTPFPKGDDMEWIRNGKIVPDFVNEVATPNPSSMIWSGVYSICDIPPVMQKAPFEDGSFGLESVNELRFKFSREVLIDNRQSTSKAIAYVGDERWLLSWSATDSMLVMSRDIDKFFDENANANVTASLAGNYEIAIYNIYGKNTDKGADVKVHYHFGAYERNPVISTLVQTDWRNDGNDINSVPIGMHIWDGVTDFENGRGDGTNRNTKSRLYYTSPETSNDVDCGMYFSARGSSDGGHLYYGYDDYNLYMTPGTYALSFRAAYWDGSQIPVTISVFPKNASDNPQLSPVDESQKNMIGTFTPTINAPSSKIQINTFPYGSWDNSEYTFLFTIYDADYYVLEWVSECGKSSFSKNYGGCLMSNFNLSRISGVLNSYVYGLLRAIDAAEIIAEKAELEQSKYGGYALDMLRAQINDYKVFSGTAPSQWTEAKSVVDTYAKWVKERRDTIDAFYDKVNEARVKYYSLDANNTLLDVACELRAKIDTASSAVLFPITQKYGYELDAYINDLDALMAALDDRVGMNEKLIELITEAQQYVNEAIRSDYDEYSVLCGVLPEVMSLDLTAATDDQVTVEYIKLLQATSLYASKLSGWQGITKRIKGLRLLAQELGSDVANNKALNQIVDSLQVDDDNIAEIYRTAIKLAIYEKLATYSDQFDGGFDVTPLLKNYNLYATVNSPVVDRSDLQISTFGIQYNERKGEKYPESSIMKIKYEFGQDIFDKNIWVLMFDTAYSDVFPGWSVKSMTSGSYGEYGMATPDPTVKHGKTMYSYLSVGASLFDGALSLDWNSKAELQTVVEGLPVGIYSLSVQLTELSATNSVGTSLSVTTRVGNDSMTLTTEATNDGARTLTVDDITVEDGMMDIDLLLQSDDGFSQADNFTLTFRPDGNFYYWSAIDEVRNELTALLNGAGLGSVNPVDPQEPDPMVTETYRMYMDTAHAVAGSQVVIPIRMQNTGSITAFSFDVNLPSGITFVSAQLASGRKNGHSIYSNTTSNWGSTTVSIASLSLNNDSFIGNDGTVVNLVVNLSENMNGLYTILLKNIEMTATASQKYNPTNFYGAMYVMPYIEPGDVNGDGSISISDAVGVVSFIINSGTQGLERRAADANQDGYIDVSDVVWVVNKVIRRSSYAPLRGAAKSEISSSVALDDVVSALNMSLNVRIEGMQYEVTAVQFNMALPKDVSVKGVTTDDDHMAVVQKQDDGTYMVVCLSLNNSTFAGGGESALTFELESNNTSVGGEVSLKNVLLVTPGGLKKSIESVRCNLCGDGLTGIRGIDDDSNANMYDLQGRIINSTNGIYIRDGKKRVQMK